MGGVGSGRKPWKVSARSIEERNTLMLEHLWIVKWAVRRFFRISAHWLNESSPRLHKIGGFEEACSIGYFSLLRAAEVWFPGRAGFASFALKYIYGAFRSQLADVDLIHTPHDSGEPPYTRKHWEDEEELPPSKEVEGATDHRFLDIYWALDRLPLRSRKLLVRRFWHNVPVEHLLPFCGHTPEDYRYQRRALARALAEFKEVLLEA